MRVVDFASAVREREIPRLAAPGAVVGPASPTTDAVCEAPRKNFSQLVCMHVLLEC